MVFHDIPFEIFMSKEMPFNATKTSNRVFFKGHTICLHLIVAFSFLTL